LLPAHRLRNPNGIRTSFVWNNIPAHAERPLDLIPSRDIGVSAGVPQSIDVGRGETGELSSISVVVGIALTMSRLCGGQKTVVQFRPLCLFNVAADSICWLKKSVMISGFLQDGGRPLK
jgi:hypothetical protein